MAQVAWYPDVDIVEFPPIEQALAEPDGLLLMGGTLSPSSLINAYEHGIFPWFSADDPIMWWSPSARAVLATRTVHISKNMKKLQKQCRYHVVIDRDFDKVIACCAALRGADATWITPQMQSAYIELSERGIAHCVSVYNQYNQLVGGLYGVFVKNLFCGESMFSIEPNTSKLALITLAGFLAAHGCDNIDCQLPTSHLQSMGATTISRQMFLQQLRKMNNNVQLSKQTWGHLWQRYSA